MNFMKTLPVGAALFHVDEASDRFSQFFERA
jgi:hypothetical protein